VSIAKRYKASGLSFQDLSQEGILGKRSLMISMCACISEPVLFSSKLFSIPRPHKSMRKI
jgi:hypothetical protein